MMPVEIFIPPEADEQFKRRLTQEGRWSAYMHRRRVLRKRLGVKTGDSKEMREVLQVEFSPSTVAYHEGLNGIDGASSTDEGTVPWKYTATPPEGFKWTVPAAKLAERRSNLKKTDAPAMATLPSPKVIKWVARHLSVQDIEAKDAPTAEAWAMLEWARGKLDDFWTQMYGKLIVKETQPDLTIALDDDGTDLGKLISRHLAEVADAG